jgi:hypothetical protein
MNLSRRGFLGYLGLTAGGLLVPQIIKPAPKVFDMGRGLRSGFVELPENDEPVVEVYTESGLSGTLLARMVGTKKSIALATGSPGVARVIRKGYPDEWVTAGIGHGAVNFTGPIAAAGFVWLCGYKYKKTS